MLRGGRNGFDRASHTARGLKDWRRIQPAIDFIAKNPTATLNQVAKRIGQSAFYTHRMLRRALSETPKQFALRVRLDRAAAALVTSKASILDIALGCGFESHEVFCRAFRKRFEMSPSAYRKQGLQGDPRLHWALVNQISQCLGLYHLEAPSSERTEQPMEYPIERRELTRQPILVVRRRVARSEIAKTIGAELGKVFHHAQKHAIALTGHPITRYLEATQGMVTIETGARVSSHPGEWTSTQGEGDVLAEALPAGPAAVTVHSGPYEGLQDAYAALEQWIAAHGFQSGGAPWEAYLNDPGEYPDPKEWKTEVSWPIQR